MRYFQLPSADPLFQKESLQLLADMQATYKPALGPEIWGYVEAQAPFIIKEASRYRSRLVNWSALLGAGQKAFVEIWQECQANQEKLPVFIKTQVGETMRAVAVSQLAGDTTSENLMSWARDAGESDAIAAAFAEYYLTESAEYEREMAEEVTRLNAEAPIDDEGAARVVANLAVVAKDTTEIPATVLSWAWAYIEKYKAALTKGHSPEWADTYARHFNSWGDESDSEKEAYSKMRQKHPNLESSAPDPSTGANSYPTQERVNKVVYEEAYAVHLDRGHDYADAYARTVGIGEYEVANAYAKAFAQQKRAGKSELFADYYASEVSNEADPKYAALEAEIYEQALADGMTERWARKYAERLAANLIKYAEFDEAKEFYIREAAEYIAKKQQKR